MSKHYILEGKEIKEATLMEWAKSMENHDSRRVDETTTDKGRVSTVFLGLDHSFEEGADPILFETMVFGGEMNEEMERCCTYDEAVKMHEEMRKRVNDLKG